MAFKVPVTHSTLPLRRGQVSPLPLKLRHQMTVLDGAILLYPFPNAQWKWRETPERRRYNYPVSVLITSPAAHGVLLVLVLLLFTKSQSATELNWDTDMEDAMFTRPCLR